MSMNWGTFPNLETAVLPSVCVDLHRFADMLIGRYGHKALVSDIIDTYLANYGRRHADRTDHHADKIVFLATRNNLDAETHGGDGNSGDMDSPAETSAEGRDGDTSAGGSEGEEPSKGSGDLQSSASSQIAGDNKVDSDGATGLSSDNTEVGNPGDDQIVANAAAGQSGNPEDGQTDTNAVFGLSGGGNSGLDKPPVDNQPIIDGGGNGSFYKISEEFDVDSSERRNKDVNRKANPSMTVNYKAAKQVAAISCSLQKLLGTLSSTTSIPRWDGRKVVAELVNRQTRIHRMHQVQRTPMCVLVIGDVSGSCKWLADLVMPIVFGLAKSSPMVVGTYTGDQGREGTFSPDSIIGRQSYKFRHLPSMMDNPSTNRWKKYNAAGITHLLVIGDVQGYYSYVSAADAGIKVLWCNPNKHLQPEQKDISAYDIKYVLIQDKDIAGAISKLI